VEPAIELPFMNGHRMELSSEKTFPCIELPIYCYLNTGIHNDHHLHYVFFISLKNVF